MIFHRTGRLVAAAALAGLLGGCVAVAIPVLAGGAIARQQTRHRAEKPAPPAPPSQPAPSYPVPVVAAEQTAGEPVALPQSLSAASEPPIPFSAALNSFSDFTYFALEKAKVPPAGQLRSSVILADGSTLTSPKLDSCADLAPAVVVDLDPGDANFDPARSGTASPGLPEALAAMRAAGLTILWASSLKVDQAQPVYVRLRSTGLDPAGTDRLLLQRKPGERKQTRLRVAAKAYCIIAMAGDKRGDFDELYDYLRDPNYALGMDRLFGAGWFIGPSPIH